MAQRTHPATSVARREPIPAPPLAAALFGSTRFAWLWLGARAWAGWLWLDAGRDKLGDDRWMAGDALREDWSVALTGGDVHHPVRWAVEAALERGWEVWLAPVLAVGQTLVGIAVLLGLLTGVAALAGLGLAATPGLAGSAGADPIVALLAVGLVIAWRCAGWIGLDRWVLPLAAGWRGARVRSGPGHPGRPIRETDPSRPGNAPGRVSR